jgi:hypothetical protein
MTRQIFNHGGFDMQLAIDFEAARESGNQAATACLHKAQRLDPTFSEKAASAILAHLQVVKQASGESLTDIAIAHGARPHDQRAFGAVFASLSRKNLIRTVGFCMREKGHGTAGGRIWGICQ